MSELDKLHEMRRLSGEAMTLGLSDDVIAIFLQQDPRLRDAINNGYLLFHQLAVNEADKQFLLKNERDLVNCLQKGIVNFYDPDSVNPYVPLAASGPWMVTSHGAVLHDSGGYGMLGFGQNTEQLNQALTQNQVIANVMTASFSQKRMVNALNEEVGHTRRKKITPYEYLFLNSGSEGMTLASRLSDLNALQQTQAGASHEGKTSRFISLKGSFHGRTDRPAQVSHSSQKAYQQSLYSFQQLDNLLTVTPNDVTELQSVVDKSIQDGFFIEAIFMEPVMGEGDPGLAIQPAFYAKARELMSKHGGLMIVDSVQAGIRATGYLSIMDYPGFRDLPPPDIEVFSKAINGGQYPLSVIGLNDKVKEFFKIGLYGNTMTANPRAMDVGCAVLTALEQPLRDNIAQMGRLALEKFSALQTKYPAIITKVQGTGLLFSVSLDPEVANVVGENGIEKQLRQNGIGVIHGGHNALRFTPHFGLTEAELDLMVSEVDKVFAPLS